MTRTAKIGWVLFIGFVVYVTARGNLPAYFRILWKANPVPKAPANPAPSGAGTSAYGYKGGPSATGYKAGPVAPGLSNPAGSGGQSLYRPSGSFGTFADYVDTGSFDLGPGFSTASFDPGGFYGQWDNVA